jgi:signal transduction histidine kinase
MTSNHKSSVNKLDGLVARQSSRQIFARDAVLRALLGITSVILGLLLLLLVLSFTVAGNSYILPRVIVGAGVFGYILLCDWLYIHKRFRITSTMLVALFIVVSSLSVWEWGINVPFALLVMSIAVTLSAILLSAKFALVTAVVLSLVMLIAELLNTFGLYTPNTTWQAGAQPKLGEALGYCLLITILAYVSWLFGKQIDVSLKHARKAELALLREKRLLAVRLDARTEELRTAQLQEMQQLHKFAELGQLSTAFVHDVANHLNVLALDIETLKEQYKTNTIKKAVDSANQSIELLDNLTKEIRIQLRSEETPHEFNTATSLEEIVSNLHRRFETAQVKVIIRHGKSTRRARCFGEPVRFGQVMTMLIMNALDATKQAHLPPDERVVTIETECTSSFFKINISDLGGGVAATEQERIFTPFHSTKKNGMGIGLFIAKTVIETQFEGTLRLSRAAQPTTFGVTLPRYNKSIN